MISVERVNTTHVYIAYLVLNQALNICYCWDIEYVQSKEPCNYMYMNSNYDTFNFVIMITGHNTIASYQKHVSDNISTYSMSQQGKNKQSITFIGNPGKMCIFLNLQN